jgi:hypothetical protein
MNKTAIIIAITAITMMAQGQGMRMDMDGDDPTEWVRQWMNYDLVTDYLPYHEELTNLDSIVSHGVNPCATVDARGISTVLLTSDSLSIDWKTRRLQHKYYGLDFDVVSVEHGDPSPIHGWTKTVFILDGNEDWTQAKATLLATDNRWRLYVQDQEAVYFFRGWK